MRPTTVTTAFVLAAAAALAGCDNQTPAPSPSPSEVPTEGKRSIFRPEFQVEPIEGVVAPKPLHARVTFEEGSELSETSRAELATVLASPQVADGGTIILRGHSDAGGSDAANLRASKERAEAVRDWLVENGMAEDRITVIAFGEQNPLRPNALPDGTPNEAGRAANRRVEIEVTVADPPAGEEKPTLAETLSDRPADE